MIGALDPYAMEIGMTATLRIIAGRSRILQDILLGVSWVVLAWPAFSPKKHGLGSWVLIGAALLTYVMVQGGHLSLQVETAMFIALCLSLLSTGGYHRKCA